MSIFDWLVEKPESAVLKKGDYKKSVDKIVRNAEKSKKKDDIARMAWLYQMASVLARRAREWDDSIKYALLAAEYSEKEGKKFNAGWAYRSAAIAAGEKKDFTNSVNYAVKGADSFMLSKSSYAAKWCYNIAAESCREAGEVEKALKFCEKAHSIEPDNETCEKISELKEIVNHPKVDQYPEKTVVTEYEPVGFEIVVENHSKEVIKNIVIGSKDGKTRHNIDSMKPEEVKVFSYETTGKPGYLKSPFCMISWENGKGEKLDMELEPAELLVKPRIQINSYISPDPVLNKASELVILVKNLSSSPLYDVRIDADFPHVISSSRLSPDVIEKISPGEEIGTDWKIEPSVLGQQKIASGLVIIHDENGIEYEERIPQISADVLEKPHPGGKPGINADQHREEKKHFDASISANPMEEDEYIDLHKKLWHQQKGYTFHGPGLDVVTHHVEENCRDMSLVSRHDFSDERMLLFSFRLGETAFLLTVIIKEEEGFVHLVLKAYSDNKDMVLPVLEKISRIIRYTINTEKDVKEVEKVEIKKVVNIVDSIVQRCKIASGNGEGEVTEEKTKIADSVVQRSDV